MGAELVGRFVLASLMTIAIPSAASAQKVFGPFPGHVWDYEPSKKAVIYGKRETDDTIVTMACRDGLVAVRLPLDNNPTHPNNLAPGKRKPGGEVSVFLHRSGQEKFEISVRPEKFVYADEFQAWEAVIEVAANHPLFEFLKPSGIVEVDAAFRYRLSTRGAVRAIEKLQAACVGPSAAQPASVATQIGSVPAEVMGKW
jgi:hypothetical protein